MIQRNRVDGDYVSLKETQEDDEEGLDFDLVLSMVQRQWKVVAAAMVVGFALGLAYLMIATPLYTSSTRILYEKTKSKAVDEYATESAIFGDQAEFASQLVLIRSQRITDKIVDALKLHLNDKFLSEGRSGISTLIGSISSLFDVSGWFSDPHISEAELDARKRLASAIISRNVSVRRVGNTYILQLDYRSESPELAQKIASQFAKTYLNDQLDSKYDATRRASEWLQTRITELKDKSFAADLAMQKYREDHNLVKSGSGEYLADEQLAGATARLIKAQGEVAARKAEFDVLNSAVEKGDVTVVVEQSLGSSIIGQFRAKYLELSKREAAFSAKLGEGHEQVVNLRNEMKEYQRLMFEELSRIRDVAKSKYDAALEQQKVLEADLEEMAGETSSTNRVLARLRELEQESASYKSLLQNFLGRYQEALQQQSYPVNDARVLNEAFRPGSPSHPRKGMSLAIALVLGGLFGVGIAAFREFRERFFRTGDQVRDVLGLEFLGLIPRIDISGTWVEKTGSIDDMNVRAIRHSGGMSNYVVNQPLSSFAEAIRGAKVAADINMDGQPAKVIGVVSTLPSEGKSTVASNFAQLLAMQGASTFLIDGDMRNPGLTRMLARHAKSGLVDVLMGNAQLDEAIMFDPGAPKLNILPAVIKSRISHTSDLLASQSMQRLIMTARERYDYIIVDLPPMAPVVDVKAFAKQVDGFVMVVEWGQISRSLVKSIVDCNPFIRDKCLGVVLNKADMDQMKLYRTYGSSEYYYSSFGSYYRDDQNLSKMAGVK